MTNDIINELITKIFEENDKNIFKDNKDFKDSFTKIFDRLDDIKKKRNK